MCEAQDGDPTSAVKLTVQVLSNLDGQAGGQTSTQVLRNQPLSSLRTTLDRMCKAVDRGMVIAGVRLLEKHGGKSGSWVAGNVSP